MTDYHESEEKLSEKAHSLTRALNSLKEEIEAVDWYNQRRDVEKDDALRSILKHNMLEEIEHACMTIEWLRRNMEGWDEELNTYLFKEEDVTDLE